MFACNRTESDKEKTASEVHKAREEGRRGIVRGKHRKNVILSSSYTGQEGGDRVERVGGGHTTTSTQ